MRLPVDGLIYRSWTIGSFTLKTTRRTPTLWSSNVRVATSTWLNQINNRPQTETCNRHLALTATVSFPDNRSNELRGGSGGSARPEVWQIIFSSRPLRWRD